MSGAAKRLPVGASVRLMAVGEARSEGAEWEALRLGPVVDDRTGETMLVIDEAMLDAFVEAINGAVESGSDIPIDWSHGSERGSDEMYPTLGVVTGARREGDRVLVAKRLNVRGALYIAGDQGQDGQGVSLRVSPTIHFRPLFHPSEPGRELAPLTVSSVAVTDRPRQNGLAAISLSRHGESAMLARYDGPDGSAQAHREALARAADAALRARGLLPDDDAYMAVVDWSTEAAIVEVWVEDEGSTLYRIPYTEDGDTIVAGAPEQVELRVTYEPKAAALVAVEMTRPTGARAGGADVANQPQATETTPEATAPAPDKVEMARPSDGDVALLAKERDAAKAEAERLTAELAKVKAEAGSLDRTVATLSKQVEALTADAEARKAADRERQFAEAWGVALSKGGVVAGTRDAWHADFKAAPEVTLACLSRVVPGAAGVKPGKVAGSPGPAADADVKGPADVVALCKANAEANGTDFETEFKKLRDAQRGGA